MNDTLRPDTPAGSHTTRLQRKPSRRSLAILIALAIVALGLMILPQPTLYFPRVVIDVPGEMQLDFLLDGQQDKPSCIKTSTNIASAIRASCIKCKIRLADCLADLSDDQAARFGTFPLPVPSSRMANGTVNYHAADSKVALLACRESERQAQLAGNKGKVACYPANSPRPHTPYEIQINESAHSTLTVLLTIIGGLVITLIAVILMAHLRQQRLIRQILFESQASSKPLSPFGRGGETTLQTLHPWLEKFTLAGVDVLILLGTFLAFAWPESEDATRWGRTDRTMVIGQAVIIATTIGWFWLLLEHYARRRPFWDELREIFHVLAIMTIVSGTAAFVIGMDNARSSHLIVWSLNLILIPVGRSGSKRLLDDLGLWQRPALIIGSGENAHDAYLAISSEQGMGYHILGFVSISQTEDIHPNSLMEEVDASLRLSGKSEEFIERRNQPKIFSLPDGPGSLESLLATLNNPQIIVALDSLTDPGSQILVQRILATNNHVHIIPSIRGLPLFGTQLSHFFSHEVLFLTVRNNLARRGYVWIKRIFDLVVASLLLILLSPVFAVISYLIRRNGGSAYYGHTRVGRNGVAFECLKFRSMRLDADEVLTQLLQSDPAARAEWEQSFKLKNDPRITPIGNFLRKTSLDELPQLINVIRGEMSLVGPRPVITAELERYGDHVNLYLQVLPGITGLWQVSGRSDTGYDERVGLDAWYVQNWSLWYDIAILFKTINTVLNGRGAY